MENLATGWRPFFLLTALCALLFMPGLASIPATDRDEARFMQATKQMLETGDLVNIRFQSDLRTKKPVGIHWLQVLSVKISESGSPLTVWAYRLPSALAAWFAVLCVFFAGRRLFDAQSGLMAAMLTACTLILMVEAHLAKTDAVLLLTVVIAQLCLLEFYRGGSTSIPNIKVALMFWAAVGLGLLIKGPVICAVLIATIVMLGLADRNLQWLRGLSPETGIPIALAFVLPWILATAASGNGDVLAASLSEDFVPKLLGGAEGHGAPPGTHLLLAPITLWPASLILLPGLVLAWQRRNEPVIRYALAWAGATWLMFELVPTKLPHYILPAVPALALAVAGSWKPAATKISTLRALLWSLVSALLVGILLWATWTYGGSLTPAVLLAIALVFASDLVFTGKAPLVLIVPAVACTFAITVFSGILPRLSDLALSERLAASVQTHSTSSNPPVALSQYHEPSAVFLLGTETWLTNARNSAAHVAADPSAFAGVTPDQLPNVIDMVEALNGAIIVVDQISGFNYSKGRPETIVLVRSEPKTDTP